jgi:xanthine/uracil/vitamin C permease (AzgA family)
VLVLVGVLMMQGLLRIAMSDLVNAGPIVLTLLVTAPTNNLVNGMARGTLSYIRAKGHHGLLLQDSSDRLGTGRWCSLAMRS